jgi:hypothetical protein
MVLWSSHLEVRNHWRLTITSLLADSLKGVSSTWVPGSFHHVTTDCCTLQQQDVVTRFHQHLPVLQPWAMCHADTTVNICEIFPLSEEVNFVLLPERIFPLNGCMSINSGLWWVCNDFPSHEEGAAFHIMLKWYISIYTRVSKIKSVDPHWGPCFMLHSLQCSAFNVLVLAAHLECNFLSFFCGTLELEKRTNSYNSMPIFK